MKERSEIISWLRGDLVGPTIPISEAKVIEFSERDFTDHEAFRQGPLAWRPTPESALEEVLYFERESPHRKYGSGRLHPAGSPDSPDEAALLQSDSIGVEHETDFATEDFSAETVNESENDNNSNGGEVEADDFEVTSADVRRPSSMGISFCARLTQRSKILIQAPTIRRFDWQTEGEQPFPVNGRYEACKRHWVDEHQRSGETIIWRRLPAVLPDTVLAVEYDHLSPGRVLTLPVQLPEGSPLALRFDIFPRLIDTQQNIWLFTIVLRNLSIIGTRSESREATLYQTFFEVSVEGGNLQKYPESQRPFDQLDQDEKSLALLYRESATWGIGHGCSAAWDADPDETPLTVYADVLPAVQLPSMTPDIEVNGAQIKLSMRELGNLTDNGIGSAWEALESLVSGYEDWINTERKKIADLPANFAEVATGHLDACKTCLNRIKTGIIKLREDANTRRAFRLANLSMLLQQIGTKQLVRRALDWDSALKRVTISEEHNNPWEIYEKGKEDKSRVGMWRAFQIAFLLMSLDGVRDGRLPEREVVDLVWFPTGGGKTEAYLAVMAFYMFYERILMEEVSDLPRRDGTNIVMRYTLRMLTTQQFQRAASLICGMEFLRRNPDSHDTGTIPGRRFSLGLWIGGEGSPNKINSARSEIAKYRRGDTEGNPLVITECPWCRAEIGRYDGPKPQLTPFLLDRDWNSLRVRGITENGQDGPLLHCPDSNCAYGQEHADTWLPVEVIDERIYRHSPSLVIATADKLAMIAYRPGDSESPGASELFGRGFVGGKLHQHSMPPGLIIQDELHLISGPLGTMYALYEGVIERLCSFKVDGKWIKPKIIASTATIRGADEQVNALYGRTNVQLFPSPGLSMGDSFFGNYARDKEMNLSQGRLYLGIHPIDYGSILTAQVRAFSSALFRPYTFDPDKRDPWWTLLTFYNSIRELSGAKTLFDSDIRSRLKLIFNREGYAPKDRRNLTIVEELTSRLSQAEIVKMMDQLAEMYNEPNGKKAIDACLASNIIEVGVDIDRLSIMGVVGQPKSTSSYIQVTGRVGRRWWDRPGLILMIYNPSKSRDRSHYEQFHGYHRRLYERVEPTTATPFAVSAIQRGLAGVLIAWSRQHSDAPVKNRHEYMAAIEEGYQLIRDRCKSIQYPEDQKRSLAELERVRDELIWKWEQNPQQWEQFPPKVDGEYLMLWPGQFSSAIQKKHGIEVPSSMRQVDRSAELTITQGYALEDDESG